MCILCGKSEKDFAVGDLDLDGFSLFDQLFMHKHKILSLDVVCDIIYHGSTSLEVRGSLIKMGRNHKFKIKI